MDGTKSTRRGFLGRMFGAAAAVLGIERLAKAVPARRFNLDDIQSGHIRIGLVDRLELTQHVKPDDDLVAIVHSIDSNARIITFRHPLVMVKPGVTIGPDTDPHDLVRRGLAKWGGETVATIEGNGHDVNVSWGRHHSLP